MEFNQDNRSFCTTVAVLDTVAEQLADVDLTLPDYCPDIEKILKCTLIPKIQTRTLSGVNCKLTVTVLLMCCMLTVSKKVFVAVNSRLIFLKAFLLKKRLIILLY